MTIEFIKNIEKNIYKLDGKTGNQIRNQQLINIIQNIK